MKLPAFQFYPGDWLRDGVSGCSLAAQGLWLRLMLLMHDSERYGYLCNNGSPIPSAQLARRCGCTLAEFEELIAELDSAGVPSRTKDGIIYSRRMSRDAEARAQNADRQRKHYEAKKQEPNGQSNVDSNADLTKTSRQPNKNLTPPLQSSSSSSSSKTERGRARDDSSWSDNPAVQAYREKFLPEQPLAIGIQDQIIANVSDLPTWAAALDFWFTNNYRPESVGKIINKYNELRKASEEKSKPMAATAPDPAIREAMQRRRDSEARKAITR
jgi:hypothetical protein